MNILDYLKNNILYLDGGMGTLLQERGMQPGELSETWNLSHPDVIAEIHRSYFEAGSNLICANTFGANSLKYTDAELDAIVAAAMQNAFRAKTESKACQEKWVALDIGPTGRMLAPYGDLDFEDAVAIFAKSVKLGVKYGADVIFIETMNDSYETKAAVLAAKENSNLPVFVSNAYGEDGKLMTGANASAMVAMLEGLGADAIGVNCSLGPKALHGVVEEYLKYSSIPVIMKPNAGLPKSVNGKTVFDVLPDEFSCEVASLAEKGVRAVGGCCGTTPEHIKALTEKAKHISPLPVLPKDITCVSSYTHAVFFEDKPVLIGERINPTGKKRFKEALKAGDMDYILKEGISQQDKGVDILDVNVGLPDIDETAMLKSAVCELQAIINLPLQIDTANPAAMEAALRRYNGKAMLNSVSGKKESMDAVFPLAKKYGGLIVALTLDDNGIPETAEGRVSIAKVILAEASKYGISKKDLIFDPLALTISADSKAAVETLKAVKIIRNELGCHTSLGVSNISFGLPHREAINSNFFTLSLWQGLSAAILNPYSDDMLKAYHAYLALCGKDDNCEGYISFAQTLPQMVSATVQIAEKAEISADASELHNAITKGLKERAALLTKQLLDEKAPLAIIQEEIIPALNTVGIGFENKTVYLPQLLMSAEAAKYAFEEIKTALPQNTVSDKCAVVLATVKGDIHDIGKNIVKLLLQNYGFAVTDLGRDVAPEFIAAEAARLNAPLVGLSALMTTTVPSMEETIKLLRKTHPSCKIVVGGAVLNEEYAAAICADKYARDAMETVRYAEYLQGVL